LILVAFLLFLQGFFSSDQEYLIESNSYAFYESLSYDVYEVNRDSLRSKRFIMPARRITSLFVVLAALLLFLTAFPSAQEATPEPTTQTERPTEQPTPTDVLPTFAPSETPSPVPPTKAPLEDPTQSASPTATAEITSEATEETAPEPTAIMTAAPDPLSLVFSTGFEATAPELSIQGWIAVHTGGGQALQSGPEASTITYNTAYEDAALRLRVLLNDGTLSLTLRQNADAGYVFILNHEGALRLLRDGVEVASAQVALVAGEWVALEARVIGGALSASLNGETVLSTIDANPLPLGGLSAASSAAALLRVDDLSILARGEGMEYAMPTPVNPTSEDEVTGQAQLFFGTAVNSCLSSGQVVSHFFTYSTSYWNYILDLQRTSGDLRYNLRLVGPGIDTTIPSAPDGRAIIYGPDHGGGSSGSYTLFITGTFGSGCVNSTVWSGYRPQNQIGWGFQSGHHTLKKWRYNLSSTMNHQIRVERTEGSGAIQVRVWSPSGSLLIDSSSSTGVFAWDYSNGPSGEYNVEINITNGSYRWSVNSDLVNLARPTGVAVTNRTFNSATISWVDNSFGEHEYHVVGLNGLVGPAFLPPDTTSYTFTGLSCSTSYRAFIVSKIANRNSDAGQIGDVPYSGFANVPPFSTLPCPPTNDEPGGALVMSNTSYPNMQQTSNTENATRNVNDPSICVSNYYSNTTWYRWTADSSRWMKANTYGSSFDTVLAVMENGTNTVLACNDDYFGLLSNLEFNAVAGRTYYFMIANYGSSLPEGSGHVARLTISPVLSAPVGLSPANNSVVATSPTLSWSAVSGAMIYGVYIWSGTNTSQTPLVSQNVSGTSFTPSPALGYGTYTWRVQAVDSVNEGGFFATSVFTIAPPIISVAPVLSEPTATLINNNRPMVTWNSVPNATSYVVEFSLNAFSTIVHTATVTTTTYTPPSALPDGTYSIRVRALNALNQAGPNSATKALIIDTTPPAVPVLSAPLSGLTVTSSRPTLTWVAVTGANGYHVQIAAEDSFSAPLISQVVTTTTFTPATPLPQGVWYWRVLARDAAANESQFSGARSLIVNFLISPADNVIYQVAATQLVSFAWASYASGAQYVLDISTDESFSNIAYTFITPSLGQGVSLPHGMYWWRVAPVFNGETLTPPLEIRRKLIVSPPLPTAPVLTSPTAASVTNSPVVNLAWNAPAYAFPLTYDVQADNNSTFASPEYTETNISALSAITAYLSDGTYSWRVRAVNLYGGAGPWSAVRTFTVDTTPPAAPNLSAPLDGAFISISRPTLTAVAVATATGYRFDLATDSGFSNLLLQDVPSTTVSLALSAAILPNPLPQGRYHWRVQARDLAGNWSAESASRSFVVSLLTAPTNNTSFFVAAQQAVRFAWASYGITGTSYIVEVATDEFFSNVIFSRTTTALTYTMTAAEALPHGIYWVRLLVNGEIPPSDTAARFIVSPPAPSAPVPTVPVAAFITNSPIVNLAWNAPAYAFPLTYDVQADNNSTFASPEYTETNISALSAITTSLPDGLYSWRVRAVNPYGGAGPWSAVRTFTVDTTPPAAPNPTLPADAATLLTLKPAFSWSAPVGAVRYELRLSHNSSFSRPILFFMTTPRFTLPSDLNNATYWWSVRAYDAAGNASPWSAARSFTARSLSTVVPTLCRTITPSLTLNWERVSWAVAYEYQVSTTPGFEMLNLVSMGTISGNPSAPTATTGTLGNGRFYWRVRAQNSIGVWGPWSVVTSCSVAAP
jgi:hypothetical protein